MHDQHPTNRVGSTWRIRDTGGTFTVVRHEGRFTIVANERGTERRILTSAVRPSARRNGYELVSVAPASDQEAQP